MEARSTSGCGSRDVTTSITLDHGDERVAGAHRHLPDDPGGHEHDHDDASHILQVAAACHTPVTSRKASGGLLVWRSTDDDRQQATDLSQRYRPTPHRPVTSQPTLAWMTPQDIPS